MQNKYKELKERVQELVDAGTVDRYPSDEQRADWAFGNTKIENDDATREMAAKAAREPRQAR